MKRTRSLFVLLVLCLSLCACGVENDPSSSNAAPTTHDAQNTYDIHPRLAEMCGSWINNSPSTDEFNPCLTLTINEDHTCIVDGVSYTWAYSTYATDERLVMNIYNGEECILDAALEADGTLLVCHHDKMGMANWSRADESVS